RRSFLQASAAGFAGLAVGEPAAARVQEKHDRPAGKPTQFQIACMTLPYSRFPFERALTGIKAAGYRYVAWGIEHERLPGKRGIPVMAANAPPEKAKELGKKCRDLGLEPLMMFSTIHPDDPRGLEVLKQRILQAAAGGVPQVLTFGYATNKS